jgi:phage gp46-like protein
MSFETCTFRPRDRRKLFWSTQLDACGTTTACGDTCGDAGLRYTNQPGESAYVSISTENWIAGLIANMLFTDARKDPTLCGYRFFDVNGHWSESIADISPIGTKMRYIDVNQPIATMVAMVASEASQTLQKLVNYGVARTVSATAQYAGSGSVRLTIDVVGIDGQNSNVNFIGQPLENGWVWTDGL